MRKEKRGDKRNLRGPNKENGSQKDIQRSCVRMCSQDHSSRDPRNPFRSYAPEGTVGLKKLGSKINKK